MEWEIGDLEIGEQGGREQSEIMCNESSLKSDPQKRSLKHNWLVKSENKWEKSKVLIWVYPSRCFLLALEMLTNFGSIFLLKEENYDWN